MEECLSRKIFENCKSHNAVIQAILSPLRWRRGGEGRGEEGRGGEGGEGKGGERAFYCLRFTVVVNNVSHFAALYTFHLHARWLMLAVRCFPLKMPAFL